MEQVLERCGAAPDPTTGLGHAGSLRIQVTHVNEQPHRWHVAVQNPTEAPISARIEVAPPFTRQPNTCVDMSHEWDLSDWDLPYCYLFGHERFLNYLIVFLLNGAMQQIMALPGLTLAPQTVQVAPGQLVVIM